MSRFLLLESLDPFDSNDVEQYYDLAAGLAHEGHQVTLFLVQNGVLAARRSPGAGAFQVLVAGGVEVLADDFSLRERGVPSERLVEGVTARPLEVVVDRLADGWKALWH